MGVNERDGASLYNTQLYFDDQGTLVGHHRKLQPTLAERMIHGRGDARDIFVLDTPYGRLGGLICFEHTMDLARYALTTKGEQIHVACWPPVSALTGDPTSRIFDSISLTAAKHHAFTGQTFVITVQSRVDEDAVSKLGLTGRPDMIRVGGGCSAIVGPHGQVIAGPHTDDEAIIYADIDLADIVPIKQVCDSAGHYARPDVFLFGLRPPLAGAAAGESVPPRRCGPIRERGPEPVDELDA
jgi:aliphatic nitrilase